MQVVVNSLMTSYDKAGTGPVVLMLHGWGDARHTFDAISKNLAKKFTVISIDLPGFGGTQAPHETWGLDNYAMFVADFLKKIGCQHVLAVVGHSNGGAIALRGLSTGYLQADKLVLIASAGIRDVYKGRKKALRLAAKTAKLATKPLPKTIQSRLKRKAYHVVGSDLFVAEHLQETFKRIVTDDTQADAKKMRLPCLIVYGSQDTATPPEFGKLYQKAIAGSELKIIDGADHFVHRNHTEAVANALLEFLA